MYVCICLVVNDIVTDVCIDVVNDVVMLLLYVCMYMDVLERLLGDAPDSELWLERRYLLLL